MKLRIPAPVPRKTRAAAPVKLLAALESHVDSLQQCTAPPGTPHQVLATLRVTKRGRIRKIELAQESDLPPSWTECLRTQMWKWELNGLQLTRDIDVFVTLDVDGQVTGTR